MRYKAKVANIESFDIRALKDEIAAAGVGVTGIYPGNGQLIIETPAPLNQQELTAVRDKVLNHAPVWFEWTESGTLKREKVRCAEDIDRITAQRIRALFGSGADPLQEQLKLLRLSIFAHDTALYPNDYTQAEKDSAASIRAQMKTANTRIETIRAEGKAFKQARGWT